MCDLLPSRLPPRYIYIFSSILTNTFCSTAYLKPSPTLREDPSLNKDYIVVLVSSVCGVAFFSVVLFYVLLSLKKRLKPPARPPIPRTPKKGQLVVTASSKKKRPMDDAGVDNAAFVCETDRSAVIEITYIPIVYTHSSDVIALSSARRYRKPLSF